MYATGNDPTQLIYRGNQDNRRLWVAVGAGALAVLVVSLLIVATILARGDEPDPVLAGPVTTSPTATASPQPQTAAGTGQSAGDAGSGQAAPQGNQGGGAPGEPGEPAEPEEPGEPEETEPLEMVPVEPITITASVYEPAPVLSCLLASAKITVTGVLLGQMEIKYQFIKFGFVDQPLSDVKTIVFDTAGEATVTSGPLPKNEHGHLIQLRILEPEQINSGLVQYPACG